MFFKKLFTHSILYALAPQIPKLAGFFVLPIITRYLTSQDYGIYGVITSFIYILTGLADLGFTLILMNSYFKHPYRWRIVWRQIHFYLTIWSIIYGILNFILLYFILPKEAEKDFWLLAFLICIPATFFGNIPLIGVRYYQMAQKPLYVAIVSIVSGIISIFLTLYSVAYLKMGYLGWFIAMFGGSLVSFIFYLYPVLVKYRLSPLFVYRKKFLKQSLRTTLPTIPHNYSSYLLNASDRAVMDQLHLNVSTIGRYNMAYTFGNYFEMFGNSVGMALAPFFNFFLSKNDKESNRKMYLIITWLQVGFLIVGFLVSLWCRELFNILISNEELRQVYPIAIVIIMGYTYRPYYWLVIGRLKFTEKTTQLWKISFVAGILNVILNIIFIPLFGIMAAAVVTLVSLLYLGFSGFFLTAFRKDETEVYYPLTWIGIIIATSVLVYLIRDISFSYKLVISLLTIILFLSFIVKKKKVFQFINS